MLRPEENKLAFDPATKPALLEQSTKLANVVHVDAYEYMVTNNDWTAAIQKAIDDNIGKTVLFGPREYRITNSIVVLGQNAKAVHILGTEGGKIKLDSTEVGKTAFLIKATTSYKNRYKLFENLTIEAMGAADQSCFAYAPATSYDVGKFGVEAPFRVRGCNLYSKGYNFNFDNCNWSGDSFIRDCNCNGGGLIFVRLHPNAWISGLYPHSFSNLLIENIHFGAGNGLPKNSLIWIEGAQNSVYRNLVIEGFAKSFDPAFASDLQTGCFLHLTGGNAVLDTLWTEYGGTNTVAGKPEMSFESVGVSSVPAKFSFINGGHIYGGIKMKRRNTNSSFVQVKVQDAVFTGQVTLDIDDASFISFEDCTFRQNNLIDKDYAKNPNVTFIRPNASGKDSNTTIGAGESLGDFDAIRSVVLYEYTGGHISNEYLPLKSAGSYAGNHYNHTHNNPESGPTYLAVNPDGIGFLLGDFVDETKLTGFANVTFPCYLAVTAVMKRHHNETARTKEGWTPWFKEILINDMTAFNNLIRFFFADISGTFGSYTSKFYAIEVKDIQIAVNKNSEFRRKTSAYCYETRDRTITGTWVIGDKIRKLDVTTAEHKICTQSGTDRPISITGAIVKTGELQKLYIPTFSEFRKLIGGEFITVGAVNCRVLRYEYGATDADNYVVVDKNLVVGTGLTVTNKAPVFREI